MVINMFSWILTDRFRQKGFVLEICMALFTFHDNPGHFLILNGRHTQQFLLEMTLCELKL